MPNAFAIDVLLAIQKAEKSLLLYAIFYFAVNIHPKIIEI